MAKWSAPEVYLGRYVNGYYQSQIIIQTRGGSLGVLFNLGHFFKISESKNIYNAIS